MYTLVERVVERGAKLCSLVCRCCIFRKSGKKQWFGIKVERCFLNTHTKNVVLVSRLRVSEVQMFHLERTASEMQTFFISRGLLQRCRYFISRGVARTLSQKAV